MLILKHSDWIMKILRPIRVLKTNLSLQDLVFRTNPWIWRILYCHDRFVNQIASFFSEQNCFFGLKKMITFSLAFNVPKSQASFAKQNCFFLSCKTITSSLSFDVPYFCTTRCHPCPGSNENGNGRPMTEARDRQRSGHRSVPGEGLV